MNLTGLPVRPAGATFEEFFRPAATIGLTRTEDGEIYQVGSTGHGTRVWEPSRTRIQPGVAYWIRCQEPTRYTGPLRSNWTTEACSSSPPASGHAGSS